MKKLLKNPAIYIFLLFAVFYYVAQKNAQNLISDEPLVLRAANPPEIIMFGTQQCKYCEVARDFFARHQLPYTEHDIEISDQAMQRFYLLGGKGTPLLIINRQIIHGYDERMIRNAL